VNHTLQERYQAGESIIHRLDPRVKVVTAVLLIVGVLLTPDRAWPAYPLLWSVIGSLAAIGGLGAWRVARLGSLALPFVLAAAPLMFTTPGQPVAGILGLTVTDAGLARFAAIALRSWLAVQTALLLSLTTHPADLLWALRSLRMPHTLVTILAFMYRYLFTLAEEAQRLLHARAARSGVQPGRRTGGTLPWRAQVAGGMIGNLFLRSYERSERVYAAMLARGYDGEVRRTAVPSLSWRAIILASAPLLAVVIIQVLALTVWSR
jgi:cobalt/nickel transport system permease protein